MGIAVTTTISILLTMMTVGSVVNIHAQRWEKGNAIIPFPRVGRFDGNPSGLIPFPRIGKKGSQGRNYRQLIPYPRIGKRPFWHLDPAGFSQYEDSEVLPAGPGEDEFQQENNLDRDPIQW